MTKRRQKCPKCEGRGARKKISGYYDGDGSVRFETVQCENCKGTGYIEPK